MASSDLGTTWRVLESEGEERAGLYERRVFAHTGLTLYAGLVRPEGRLRLSLRVGASVPTEGLERQTKGFLVSRQYGVEDRRTAVHLELTQGAFRELFEVMADDIVTGMASCSDERSVVQAMRSRLDHWERFLRVAGPQGLTREDQLGLFGELCFLKTILAEGVAPATALSAWKGPSGANQDFQLHGWALEVKTTAANSPSRVRVSNELQLDETDNGILYLFHLWLRELDGQGTTLPELVEQISKSLPHSVSSEFVERLMLVGYHDGQKGHYTALGYVERQRSYYEVRSEFPRIRRADLRLGVDKVEYWIDLAGCAASMRQEATVIQRLTDIRL